MKVKVCHYAETEIEVDDKFKVLDCNILDLDAKIEAGIINENTIYEELEKAIIEKLKISVDDLIGVHSSDTDEVLAEW